MQITRSDRLRMERAHVRAWPALHTRFIDGWRLRTSGGGSQRANSVSALEFTGADLAAAITAVEAHYRACHAPPLFHTFEESAPPGLAAALQAKGYRKAEDTITMFKQPENQGQRADAAALPHGADAFHQPPGSPPPGEIAMTADPGADWITAYLAEITPDRRLINSRIVASIPQPRAYFTLRHTGVVAATALCVISDGCAVIQCVTTRTGLLRQGFARRLLTEAEDWAASRDADVIGLQVGAANAPAVQLYRQLGFLPGARNSFWVLRSG